MRNWLIIAAVVPFWTLSMVAVAQSASCSAHNDKGDTCSIDCSPGQAAECTNATGSGTPTCECSGTANLGASYSLFPLATQSTTGETQGKNISPLGSINSRKLLETDVLPVINTKLAALPLSHISDRNENVKTGQSCHTLPGHFCPVGNDDSTMTVGSNDTTQRFWGRCGGATICTPTYKTVTHPVMGHLLATGHFYAEKEPVVHIHEPNWEAIPTYFFGLKEIYRNCTTADQKFGFSQTVSLLTGSRVVKTKTVNTGESISASVGFTFIAKSKVQASYNRDVSIGSSSEKSDQVKKDFSFSVNVIVPSMSYLEFSHEFAQKIVDIDYDGSVQLDGTLKPNKAGVGLLSQVLKSPGERTFDFSGVVSNSSVFGGRTENNSRRLSAEDCKMNETTPSVTKQPFTRVEAGSNVITK